MICFLIRQLYSHGSIPFLKRKLNSKHISITYLPNWPPVPGVAWSLTRTSQHFWIMADEVATALELGWVKETGAIQVILIIVII